MRKRHDLIEKPAAQIASGTKKRPADRRAQFNATISPIYQFTG
jgi:hypothetical protein